MKTLPRWILASIALGLLAGPVLAQEKPEKKEEPKKDAPAQPQFRIIAPFGLGNPLALLENKEVQKDLKFTEEQTKKIGGLSEKYKEGQKNLANFKGKERFEKNKELTEAIKKESGEVLSADQKKRVKQLEVQQQGATAFLNPRLSGDLNLSEEQKTKVRETFKEMAAKRGEIFKEAQGNREQMQKKVAELNKGVIADIVKGLTEEQKKKWQDLVGEPFQGVLPPAGFGGGILRPGIELNIQPLQRQKLQPKKVPAKII